MTTTATATTDTTTATVARGDELTLGATVAWTKWNGEVVLSTVTSLRLLNEDVEVEGTNGLDSLSGARHTWLVMSSNLNQA